MTPADERTPLAKAARAYRLEVARWQREHNEGRYLDYAVAQRGDDLDAAIEAEAGAAPLDVGAMIRVAAKLACEDHYRVEHLNAIPPCAGAILDAEYWADKMGLRASIPSPREPEHPWPHPYKCAVEDCPGYVGAEQPRPDPGSEEEA